VSGVAFSGDGSLEEQPTVVALIASLLPADSPRVGGENPEHVRVCAAEPECGDAAARTAEVVLGTVQKLQRKREQ
jgi:hypothetical protein